MTSHPLHHSQPKKIKPLNTPKSVPLQSLSTYQDFQIKRPKNTTAFNFSWRYDYSKYTHGIGIKMQYKLLKALKHQKCLKKADLTSFQVNELRLNHNVSESIYKKIAKVKSLSVKRIVYFDHEKEHFTDKWLKHFTLLENLNYGLILDANFAPDENFICKKFNDPLGHLKYCPKAKSLSLDIAGASCYFDQVFIKFGCFPTSLKHLSIKSSLNLNELNLPLEKLQKLQSLSVSLYAEHLIHYMNVLSALPLLENLNLVIYSPGDSMNLELANEFLAIWKRITLKKQLKRLHLAPGSNFPTFQEVFNALQDNSQLTYLSLHLHETNPHLLSIAHCLQNKTQLQSLQLQIFSTSSFNHVIGFGEICSQIVHLEALRHLQLSFFSQEIEEIPHFISYFQKLFEKPVKLETLSLFCSQANLSVMIKELISGLQGTGSSLRKLKVNLHLHTEDISLIKFLPSLENIRELELPGLTITDPKAFKDLVEAVETLKNLRFLEIGQIGGTIMKAEYIDGIERILKKRGLRKFVCKTEKYITDENIKIDGKGIVRKNPFLEDAKMFDGFYGLGGNLNQDIYTWI